MYLNSQVPSDQANGLQITYLSSSIDLMLQLLEQVQNFRVQERQQIREHNAHLS